MAFDIRDHPFHLAAIFCASVYVLGKFGGFGKKRQLPPGPNGIPFLGSVFQLSWSPWREFESWSKKYGPLLYVTVLGQGVLILDSLEVATELLERRAPSYSDRARYVVAVEMLAGEMFLPLMNHGEDRFRRMNRVVQEALKKSRTEDYQASQSKEALRLVDDLLKQPELWRKHLSRTSTSTILSVIYDMPQLDSVDEPIVAGINNFIDVMSNSASLSVFLFEIFPWLKNVPSPLAKLQGMAERKHREWTDLFTKLFTTVGKRIEEGDERPSFAGTLTREFMPYLSVKECSWLSGTLYAGGTETTTSTMCWFMLAMTLYPDKQKKCQEEIDTVVGRSRMPTFQDRDHLPYLRATIRETLRWRAVTPLGLPHVSKEDDWYKGYFIPKGTICIANAWSMNRDRSIFGEDADEFNPDRFIDEQGRLRPPIADTKGGHMTYGFGPRTCPGRHMANNAAFINMAYILWALNISPCKDDSGNQILPESWTTSSRGDIIAFPKAFQCSITPRFSEAANIVAQMKELV